MKFMLMMNAPYGTGDWDIATKWPKERLDAHMTGFLDALEAFTNSRFGTICVDLGLTAQGFVFYELQIPFGNPYGRSSGTGSQHAAARSQLVKSMYLSGLVV